jgi:hypothetical protein
VGQFIPVTFTEHLSGTSDTADSGDRMLNIVGMVIVLIMVITQIGNNHQPKKLLFFQQMASVSIPILSLRRIIKRENIKDHFT